MGLDRLQAILLSSTSLVGAHIADIENRLTTAEGFTNQIASILTRLQTVEALGGISPGTDLAADGLAVRTTRYWGRPGEAIRAWTASIAAPPAAAVPLTEGGAYSIVPTALGPALRIAGAAAARPIAQVPLIEDQIEEFRVTVKRSADDATPANNAPVFVFGCFNADGTDNGTAPLPAEPLTVDQGFKTLIFRASRAAGFGTVDLPAGTRRVNLIPGGKGSGSIDVVSVERGPQSLTSAPLITTLGDTDFVATVSADRKSTSLITFAAFKDLMMEKFIPHVADATVGTAPVVLIPADPSRNNVQIINTSATSALLIGFGSPPVEGAKHTMLLPPSGGYEQRYCRTDAIYAMAKTGSVSVFANYTNRSGMDVVGDMIAAVYLARGSGNANTAERAAVTKLINRFRESGAYYKFRAAAILANIDTVTAAQDLVRDIAWSRFNGPTFTKYKGYKGNGVDQYISTNYVPSQDAGYFDATSHSFGAYVDDTLQGATGTPTTMGSATTGISANRSNSQATTRSATASSDLIEVGGRGGLFAVSRSRAASYRAIYKQTAQDVATPIVSTGLGAVPYEMFVLAQNSSSGGANVPVQFSTISVDFAFCGEAMTDAQLFSIDAAVAEYKATLATFGA
ncbi:hypothetical protein [Methylobacterium sp.]